MTNPCRALLAELLLFSEEAGEICMNESLWPKSDPNCTLQHRARALLAQPMAEVPTDEELLRVAATAIEPYENSGIPLGEYEPETECAVEVYGSELIAFARAALAKWGHQ
jgi:hypothetical protein